MKEVTPPAPAGDQLDNPRLVLRDGSVASVRPSLATDRDGIRRFFHDLSAESRRNRFFSASEPPASVIDRMADSTDPARALTLIVHRLRSDDLRPVAIASETLATAATSIENTSGPTVMRSALSQSVPIASMPLATECASSLPE